MTHEFVVNSWSLFCAIKKAEQAEGFPGPRMVIAAGFRMRVRRAGMDQSAGHFASVMARYKAGRISADQAIREASRISRSFDIVPQLQANFAFTKAYAAEASGKAGGLGGSNCFIDLAFFDEPPPDWIKLGAAIHWKDERLRMAATFAPIVDIPAWRHPEDGPVEIGDGFQVAQHLAGGIDVLKALQASPRTSHRV